MVPTELRLSMLYGFAVCLLAPVKAGELIWRFDERLDLALSNAEFEALPEFQQNDLRQHSAFLPGQGRWILFGDNRRHFNHSDSPNVRSVGTPLDDEVAAMNIAGGTELTVDRRPQWGLMQGLEPLDQART